MMLKKSLIVFFLILLRNFDVNAQWIDINSGSSSNFNAIFFTDSLTGYVAGDGILKSTDGGASWISVVPSGIICESIWFDDEIHGIAVGGDSSYSTILKSIDGINFTDVTPSFALEKLNEVIFHEHDTVGYIVGDSGYFMKSYDGGFNWQIWNTLVTTANLNDIYMFNYSDGFIVGDNGSLYSTHNGGWVWDKSNDVPISANLNSIHCINYDTGYIAADSGYILKTSNGGFSWGKLNSTTTENLNAVYFTNADTGFVVGDNGIIMNTVDGGINWNQQNSGTSYDLNCVYAKWKNFAVAAGNNGTILKTTNGGMCCNGIENHNIHNEIEAFVEANTLFINSKCVIEALYVNLIDISGKSVLSILLNNNVGLYSMNIDDRISKGVYILELKSDKLQNSFKCFIR
jgi:photosystem II stability/assembly factor-like uncharacterized protein